MVRVFAGSGAGDWKEMTRLSSVTWTESLTAMQTAVIRTPLDISPEDWPAEFIIVPMRLDAPRNASAQPPVYGPYDLVTPEYDDPRGTTFKCELGHHYGQLIADGTFNVTDQVVAQVEGFQQFEPFLGWGRASSGEQVYDAAYGSAGQGGLSYVGGRVLAELPTATSLDDVATATAVWGFALYILVEWDTGGAYSERLAVWPRHQLVSGGELGSQPGYAVQPRAGQVAAWSRGAPSAFAAPNRALENVVAPAAGQWKQRPTVSVPEALNSPAHFPPAPNRAAWNTRRIIAGRRSLSGLSGFQIFHTGGPVPPPAFWMDAAAPNARLAKGVEEIQRWDWQNQSAVFNGVRYPDLSAELGGVALAPHQLLEIPEGVLPPEWDATRRRFTVRTVRHEWDPRGGYRQNVEATLWQGPFARLTATAVDQG